MNYTKKQLKQTIENKRKIINFYRAFVIEMKLQKEFIKYKKKHLVMGKVGIPY